MAKSPPTLAERRAEAWVIIGEVFPEYHPLLHMAEIANDPREDTVTQLQASKELAQYLLPKLKATEVSVDGRLEGGAQVTVVFGAAPDPVLDA